MKILAQGKNLLGLVFALLIFSLIAHFGSEFYPSKGIDTKFLATPEHRSEVEEILALPDAQWQQIDGVDRVFRDHQISLWVKSTIVNDDQDKRWVVSNAFSWYGVFEVYTIDSNGVVSQQTPIRTNQLFPFTEFSVKAGERLDVLIHATSLGVALVDPHILPSHEFHRWDKLVALAGGMIYGCLILIIVVSFISYFIMKDSTVLWYTGYLSTVLITAILQDGSTMRVVGIEPTTGIIWGFFTWIVINLTGILFLNFLRSFLFLPPNYFRIRDLSLALVAFCLTIPAMPFSVFSTISTINIGIFTLVAVALVLRHSYVQSTFFILLGVSGIGVASLASILTLEGGLSGSFMNLRLFQIGAVWEAVFFTIALSLRMKVVHKEKKTMERVFRGDSPEAELNEIMEQPYGLTYKFRKDEVTIVFIDIVSFSITANRLGSKGTYEELAKWNQRIHEIIDRYNGTIDRSLGDGILCFFGFGEEDSRIHATHAFNAAVEIQQSTVQTIANFSGGNAIFPTRIGINTAEVVIGNLGSGGRVDYTMIGSGVNFASRLEGACNSFRICLSKESFQLIDSKTYKSSSMNSIFIKIKHHQEYIQAYEYNPFQGADSELNKAESLHYEQVNAEGIQRRTKSIEGLVSLKFKLTSFEVIDFSMEGFGVLSDTFIGPKTILEVELVFQDPDIQRNIDHMLLSKIDVEIKWSRISEHRFRHGLQIKGLNEEQKAYIFEHLSAAAAKRTA